MSVFFFPSEVNERAARLVATGVVLTAATALTFQTWWLVPVLALGFLLRVGWGPKISPLAKLAVRLSARLWEERPVSGPPKRFAQGVGALFTLTATVNLLLGHPTAGWTLVTVLIIFASLEAGLGFCMGCWVYGKLQQVGILPPDACVDCAPVMPALAPRNGA